MELFLEPIALSDFIQVDDLRQLLHRFELQSEGAQNQKVLAGEVLVQFEIILQKLHNLMSGDQSETNKPVYRTIFGAQVLWPLDCPDDILESVIKEIKKQQNEHKLALDKDGLKIAENLKKYLDGAYSPYWHVILGNNFGCHAMHQKNRFMYFEFKKITFLIYKAQ